MTFSLNSKNEINFSLDYLPIKGKVYKFIADKKLLIKYKKRIDEICEKKYVVYDLKNKQIETIVGYDKNLLKNIFKRIKGNYEFVLKEFLYETNLSYKIDGYEYDYIVLKRSKDEIIFINKQMNYNIIQIFKYTCNNNLNPIKKEKEKQLDKKYSKNNKFCIVF